MKTKIFIGGLVCFFLWSCASAPAPRQIQKSFPIEKSYDDVWAALIETFAELQLSILNMEKDSGLITTDWIEFTGQTNEDYCDCGGLGIIKEINRVGKFNAFVKKVSENSCEISINCMFEQNYSSFDGTNLFKRKCISTGNLEAEMFKLIESKT